MPVPSTPPLLQFLNGRFLIQAAGASDSGKVRSHNEDRLGLLPDQFRTQAGDRGFLFAVADGMGGAEKGEVASERAVETLFDAFYGSSAERPVGEALQLSFAAANLAVYQEGQQLSFGMMGTTLVACLVTGDGALVANVGDSRAYLIRGGRLQQVTEDHSWVQDQVRAGMLTPEEAQVSPQRNIITRAIGHQPTVQVDLFTLSDPQPGDVLMLCSDGLHGMVRDSELEAMSLDADLGAVAQRFVDMANLAGGHDNITCLLVRWLAASDVPGGADGLAGQVLAEEEREFDTQPGMRPPPVAPAGDAAAPLSAAPPAPAAPAAAPPANAAPGAPAWDNWASRAARTAPPLVEGETTKRLVTPRRPARRGRRVGGVLAGVLALAGMGAVAVAVAANNTGSLRGGLASAPDAAPASNPPLAAATAQPRPTSVVAAAPPLATVGAAPTRAVAPGEVRISGMLEVPRFTDINQTVQSSNVQVIAVDQESRRSFSTVPGIERNDEWQFSLDLPPGTYTFEVNQPVILGEGPNQQHYRADRSQPPVEITPNFNGQVIVRLERIPPGASLGDEPSEGAPSTVRGRVAGVKLG